MKPMIAVLLMAVFGASSDLATAEDPVALPAVPRFGGAYELKLGGRSACVVPRHRGQSRAEGGQIDVTSPSSNALAAVLSGSVAANAYLGCPGSAAERFELIQDFEITCSDKNVKTAKLSLDSVLAGFVRSKHRAETGVRLATARICPIDSPQPVMVITHPTLATQGADGRPCSEVKPRDTTSSSARAFVSSSAISQAAMNLAILFRETPERQYKFSERSPNLQPP